MKSVTRLQNVLIENIKSFGIVKYCKTLKKMITYIENNINKDL